MSRKCNCGDPMAHAKAVESAIFQSLRNAQEGNEEHWRRHAEMLEGKFKTEHGRHYGDYIYVWEN